MTDVVALAQKQYSKVNQQRVPEPVGWEDMVRMILDAIENLYVISGRTFSWSEDKINYDDSGIPVSFEDTLEQDEQQWVLQKAQIEFYKWTQASVDDATSYTTDAMSVTHGDKPYVHIGQTIDRLEGELARVWYAMTRFNQLGVSG